MSLSASSLHATFNTDLGGYTDGDEEEVDQLDSDLDGEDDMHAEDGSSASTSETRQKGDGERVPGHTLIPATRIESIMHADGSGGHMSKEALYMLSIATEEFIKRLAEAGHEEASVENRSTVDYRDIAAVNQQFPEFSFLRDTIPTPLSLSQALELRAAKEKELLEDDPAISASLVPSMTFIPSGPNSSLSSRSRTRSRQSNGKEKANGSASAGGGRRQRDTKGRWSISGRSSEHEGEDGGSISMNGTRTSGRTSRPSRTSRNASAAQGHSASVNGALPFQNGMHSPRMFSAEHAAWAMPPPAAPLSHHAADPLGHHLDPLRADERWSPARYTGPASGYLEDHRMIFSGRNGMTDNPGRTIYSQQRPPNR
ncbi:hypothetical protein B0H21DRAFT_497045 [Amylocystis lapponica]|nr:hypothetical protein B0H21DRAFT_497045 [Amylocystis lapponica]